MRTSFWQVGHLARLPAKVSGAFNFLPQAQVTGMGMVGPVAS